MTAGDNRATVYVGLGSNLDDPEAQVRSGMRALETLPKTRVVGCSALYRSAPVGLAGQPDFINAVCEIETALDPETLLSALLKIEADHGRQRQIPNGPRTLDLDLLLYGGETIATPALIAPHPRLHQRAFVLYPLAEIAPELSVPGRGSVARLLAACADQPVQRLARP